MLLIVLGHETAAKFSQALCCQQQVQIIGSTPVAPSKHCHPAHDGIGNRSLFQPFYHSPHGLVDGVLALKEPSNLAKCPRESK
jgi:hypothetical protein